MVKTYLKYQLKDVIGLITGKSCRPQVSRDGKVMYTGCNEYVLVFNIKTGDIIKKILSNDQNFRYEVTSICLDINNSSLAVGYSNGSIIIYDINNDYSQSKKFSLHKSAVTSLNFNKSGSYLASGSKDTLIYVWDLIGESVLYKLSGHKDNILKVHFHQINMNVLSANSKEYQLNINNNYEDYDKTEILISSSKDSTVKLWNLKNQETLQTIADLVHKVTDFLVVGNLLVLGSYDNKIRVYRFQQSFSNETKVTSYVSLKGNLIRQSNSKIINMDISNEGKILSVLSNDNTIEFFKVLSELEIKRRLVYSIMKKNKKNEKREKLLNKDTHKEVFEKVKVTFENGEYNFKFNFSSIFTFTGGENKINSHFFIENKLFPNIWKFATAQSNNSIDFYEMNCALINQNIFVKKDDIIRELKFNEDTLNIDKDYSFESFGHRDVLRFVKYSEMDNLFLTCSNEAVKIWNFNTLNVIKGLEIEQIIAATFILRDKYIALASRKGHLFIVETSSLDIVHQFEDAHQGEIWNIFYVPFAYYDNKCKIITSSSDKTIKFWRINKDKMENKLNIEIEKTVDTIDQITYCMLTPDRKYLIYAMLDNSIRVYYEDTNKFFINLYGHKLPVLSFDVSSDGNLLISGSADKNVKLWGLDFGDCHKSFFAHNDSVTAVKFVPKTHYFLSCSKDRVVRYWDGDAHELIMEFNHYFGEIWSIDVNSYGTNFISVCADNSIKVFELTQEQIIPDFEKEKKIDKTIDDELQKDMDNQENVNPLNKDIDKLVAIKKSLDNMSYAENLMESIDHAEKFKEEVYNYEISLEEYNKSMQNFKNKKTGDIKIYNLEEPEKPTASQFLLGKNIFDYILDVLKSIRFSELENTLNNIPYSYVQKLFFYLEYYIRNNIEVELSTRCIIFLITLYESQISNDKTLIRTIISIKKNMRRSLVMTKELLGFNIQSINFILRSYQIRNQSIEDYKNSYKNDMLI